MNKLGALFVSALEPAIQSDHRRKPKRNGGHISHQKQSTQDRNAEGPNRFERFFDLDFPDGVANEKTGSDRWNA